MASAPQHGRGTAANPANRFERLSIIADPQSDAEDSVGPSTIFFKDHTRTAIATNDSPDIGFETSLNPYRGCEHGCIYCFARPFHEFLGFSAGLDFETRIMVKHNLPQLLRKELASPRWIPKPIFISGVTDPYQPAERIFRLTRQCLEILAEFGNPIGIITKSALVKRDVDVLSRLAANNAALVCFSITTLDNHLAAVMEPRAASPKRRLEAMRVLSAAGVPTAVMVSPVIPGLNDQEMFAILGAAATAGATCASYTPIRLPLGVADLFQGWLTDHFPQRKEKILNRIRDLRGGKLNESEFGKRFQGQGIWQDQLSSMFDLARRKAGITGPFPKLSTAAFKRPAQPGDQMQLF